MEAPLLNLPPQTVIMLTTRRSLPASPCSCTTRDTPPVSLASFARSSARTTGPAQTPRPPFRCKRAPSPGRSSPGGSCIKIGLPGKSILGDYFQENGTSRRPFLLLRIRGSIHMAKISARESSRESSRVHSETYAIFQEDFDSEGIKKLLNKWLENPLEMLLESNF